MAFRKNKQKEVKTKLTALQYKRNAITTMGAAAFAGFLTFFAAKNELKKHERFVSEMKAQKQRIEQREKEHIEFRKNLEEKRKKEWQEYATRVEKARSLAKKQIVKNIESVLYADIPLQNRISKKVAFNELKRFNSPMASQKVLSIVYEYSIKKGVDPAYILAVLRAESRHGTSSVRAIRNKNPGNIKARNRKQKQDDKGFLIFDSWEHGTKAMIDRIVYEGYINQGRTMVSTIAKKYAPSVENKTNDYIRIIQSVRNSLYQKQFEYVNNQ